jgi:nitrate/nitrite transporter NarK
MGAAGVVWSVLWWSFFRDAPEAMPGIGEEELAELGAATVTAAELDPRALTSRSEEIPWRQLLRLRQLWLLIAAYFLYAWGSWFFFGWFPTWLVRGAGFSVAQMGVFAALPFLMGALGNFAGGILSERLVLRFGRRITYRTVTAVCLTVAACLLIAMSLVRSHTAVIALASCGFGVMDLMLPAAWAMCMSLGGSFGGTASGLMNTAGNLGGWICTVAFGYTVSATGNYNLPVRAIAAMVVLAAVLFACIDCTRGLHEADAHN